MINDLIKIAREAGEIAKKSDRSIKKKCDGSPVTPADVITSKYIIKELQQFGYPILSEESTITKNVDTFFIVDPIDGTKGFINHEPAWTVNIAFIKNNEPTHAVIVVPDNNEVYYAVKDKGAHSNKKLKVNTNTLPSSIACSKSHMHTVTKRIIEQLNAKMVPSSSSIKGCLVAQGKADAYVRVTPVYGWDVAAMQLIITEAGGKMTQLDGNIIKYQCQPQLIKGFIASNTLTHETLLQSYEINKRY